MSSAEEMARFHAILGIEPTATNDELRAAFHALAKQHHPDKTGHGDAARFREVREAFDKISGARLAANHGASGPQHAGSEGGQEDGGERREEGFSKARQEAYLRAARATASEAEEGEWRPKKKPQWPPRPYGERGRWGPGSMGWGYRPSGG